MHVLAAKQRQQLLTLVNPSGATPASRLPADKRDVLPAVVCTSPAASHRRPARPPDDASSPAALQMRIGPPALAVILAVLCLLPALAPAAAAAAAAAGGHDAQPFIAPTPPNRVRRLMLDLGLGDAGADPADADASQHGEGGVLGPEHLPALSQQVRGGQRTLQEFYLLQQAKQVARRAAARSAAAARAAAKAAARRAPPARGRQIKLARGRQPLVVPALPLSQAQHAARRALLDSLTPEQHQKMQEALAAGISFADAVSQALLKHVEWPVVGTSYPEAAEGGRACVPGPARCCGGLHRTERRAPRQRRRPEGGAAAAAACCAAACPTLSACACGAALQVTVEGGMVVDMGRAATTVPDMEAATGAATALSA